MHSLSQAVAGGYTGRRRINPLRSLEVPQSAAPRIVCPQCKGPAITEPALTVTKDGVTTTAFPVTCKACKVPYLRKNGTEGTRPLRSYIATDLAEPSSRPLPNSKQENTVILTDEDKQLVERVRQIKTEKGLEWPDIGSRTGYSRSAVANAVNQPEKYLRTGIAIALRQWLANQDSPSEPSPVPVPAEDLGEFDEPTFDPEPYAEVSTPGPVVQAEPERFIPDATYVLGNLNRLIADGEVRVEDVETLMGLHREARGLPLNDIRQSLEEQKQEVGRLSRSMNVFKMLTSALLAGYAQESIDALLEPIGAPGIRAVAYVKLEVADAV